MACCCSSSSAFSEADVSFITAGWQCWAGWTSVCHLLMGPGSLQGVQRASEWPSPWKTPIMLPAAFSPLFNSTPRPRQAANWIRHRWTNSTSGWIDGNWANLGRISHGASFDPAPPVNCNIQFRGKLSNPFLVNPVFMCRRIDPIPAVLLAYLSLLNKCFHLIEFLRLPLQPPNTIW